MKVYIVMEGEYSDRCIMGVFLDRKKAENYCKYRPGYFIVEEETMDDGYECLASGAYHCDVECSIRKKGGAFKTEILSASIKLCPKPEENSEGFDVSHWEKNVYYYWGNIWLNESIGDEKAVIKAMEKHCYDRCAEIADLLSQGYKAKDVRSALNLKEEDE